MYRRLYASAPYWANLKTGPTDVSRYFTATVTIAEVELPPMSSSRRNVILLTIDALRADHLSSHGYERETTPNLDRLAEDGWNFERAYSASSHTREAIPSLLTGRDPIEAVDERYTLDAESIATHCSDAGFRTGAFHSNPYVSRAYGFDEDFDRFDDDLYFGESRVVALLQRAFDKLRDRHYASAETINERALEWVDSRDELMFLWNHYMDPHGPYDPPKGHRDPFGDGRDASRDAKKLYRRAAVTDPESITDDERRELVDQYDAEIRYVDACIGDFLDALRERGVLRDSLVVVTADHGDAFGEHGRYGHPRYPTDELVHVPMIVSGPETTATSIDAPVSTLDVVPTVLDFAGVDYGELPGTSLFDVAADPDRFADRRVFSNARGENENSNLRRFGVRSAEERYLAERNRDTGEIRRTDGDVPDPELEGALRDYVADLSADERAAVGRDEGTDDEIDRRLEALGYKE